MVKFKGFEIRPYQGDKHKLEVIKWTKNSNGKDYCFVVAFIDWDDDELSWDFRSVGTRFLDYYEDGLCEFIKKFLDLTTFLLYKAESGEDVEI